MNPTNGLIVSVTSDRSMPYEMDRCPICNNEDGDYHRAEASAEYNCSVCDCLYVIVHKDVEEHFRLKLAYEMADKTINALRELKREVM